MVVGSRSRKDTVYIRLWNPAEHGNILFTDKLPDRKTEKPSTRRRVSDSASLGEEERMEEETEDGAGRRRTGRPPLCLWSLLPKNKRSEASMPCC